MRKTVGELFVFHSGSGALTEKEIYDNQPINKDDSVLVYSGATDDNNNLPSCSKGFIARSGAPLISGGGILVSRKGQAGSMRLIEVDQFTINDNAYVMKLRRGAEKFINQQFFVLAFQDLFFDLVTSKDGNGTFSKSVAEKLIIEVPDIRKQLTIAASWLRQTIRQRQALTLLNKVQKASSIQVVSGNEKTFLVKELFDVTSGVRITQREVYEHPGSCPVVTSQTTNGGVAWYSDKKWLSTFRKNKKPVLINRKCITWAKDGNAGKLFIREGEFYPNDHAGVLLANKNIDPEWFFFSQQGSIYEHATAKCSQGMLYENQMANIPIEVPVNQTTLMPDIDMQSSIVAEYERLKFIESNLQAILSGVDSAIYKLRQLAVSLP